MLGAVHVRHSRNDAGMEIAKLFVEKGGIEHLARLLSTRSLTNQTTDFANSTACGALAQVVRQVFVSRLSRDCHLQWTTRDYRVIDAFIRHLDESIIPKLNALMSTTSCDGSMLLNSV